MKREAKLLAVGILGIAAVAGAPYARDAWREHQRDREREQVDRYIELKGRQIACLEQLRASGLPKGMDVMAEIERCRRLAIDPDTGVEVKGPEGFSGP